jgi:hypothetical protein
MPAVQRKHSLPNQSVDGLPPNLCTQAPRGLRDNVHELLSCIDALLAYYILRGERRRAEDQITPNMQTRPPAHAPAHDRSPITRLSCAPPKSCRTQ